MFSIDWRSRLDQVLDYPKELAHHALHYLLYNLNQVLDDAVKNGHTPFKLSPFNPYGLGGLGFSDKVMDYEAAAASMNYETTPVCLTFEQMFTSPDSDEGPEQAEIKPLLQLKKNLEHAYTHSLEEVIDHELSWIESRLRDLELPKEAKLVDFNFVTYMDDLCGTYNEHYSRETFGHITFGNVMI